VILFNCFVHFSPHNTKAYTWFLDGLVVSYIWIHLEIKGLKRRPMVHPQAPHIAEANAPSHHSIGCNSQKYIHYFYLTQYAQVHRAVPRSTRRWQHHKQTCWWVTLIAIMDADWLSTIVDRVINADSYRPTTEWFKMTDPFYIFSFKELQRISADISRRDLLLVFYSDLKSRWNRFWVKSR